MKITNYKTFLFARKMKDSKEAYRAYCDEFVFPFPPHIPGMSEEQKEMHVKITYTYRFVNAWM